MSWETVSWASEDKPTKTKLDKMLSRDEANKDDIETVHDHSGGTKGGMPADAVAGTRGVVVYFNKTIYVTGSNSGVVWLTSDGTSSGTNLFTDDMPPQVVVRAGKGLGHTTPESGSWSDAGMGHKYGTIPSGNGDGRDYYSNVDQDGSNKWFVEVFNESVTSADVYIVVALGEGV